MLFFYTVFIKLYKLAIKLASPFNAKAKIWLSERLQQASETLSKSDVWVHCASLGEFEQARPVLRALQNYWPEKTICLSFFSPSGFLNVKASTEFNSKAYIPLDTPKHATQFINQVDPSLVIFIKNDFWYNHLNLLNHRKIPFICVSTTVRSDAFYLKAYAKLFRKILAKSAGIFVQDEFSLKLLTNAGFKNVLISGDTRLDQVIQLAKEHFHDIVVETFKASEKLVILASTHAEDDKICMPILKALSEKSKVIIAPHDIEEERIRHIEQQIYMPAIRYSQGKTKQTSQSRIMILDNIGFLSRLYRYADVVYIGGGFGKGIHNTLEPAAYGLRLCFGPNYKKFNEAHYFIKHKMAVCVQSENALLRALQDGLSGKKTNEIKAAYQRYFKIFGGGSVKIIEYIRTKRLLS